MIVADGLEASAGQDEGQCHQLRTNPPRHHSLILEDLLQLRQIFGPDARCQRSQRPQHRLAPDLVQGDGVVPGADDIVGKAQLLVARGGFDSVWHGLLRRPVHQVDHHRANRQRAEPQAKQTMVRQHAKRHAGVV